MKNAIIIPARLDSKRFPGKLLKNETGKPLIQHVWENYSTITDTYVATDNHAIKKCVESFGGNIITTGKCSCGTERVYEASLQIDADVIINIQGDYPNIKPEDVKKAISELQKHPQCVYSLYYPSPALEDPHLVKVVLNHRNEAMYFSRASIPYGAANNFVHVGLYGFSKDLLKKYVSLNNPQMGVDESLEQLRILYHGITIKMLSTDKTIGINTEEDYQEYANSSNYNMRKL